MAETALRPVEGLGVRRLDQEEATNLRKIPARFEIKVMHRAGPDAARAMIWSHGLRP
jgi:hypothetical protein